MAKRKEYHQWERVYGPDLDPNNKIRAAANRATMESKVFKSACAVVGIEPTKRQASKWNKKSGLAWNRRAE